MDDRVKPGLDEPGIPQRHCEEPLRRSNPLPQQKRKKTLDCFVASAFARRWASADKRAPRNDGVSRHASATSRLTCSNFPVAFCAHKPSGCRFGSCRAPPITSIIGSRQTRRGIAGFDSLALTVPSNSENLSPLPGLIFSGPFRRGQDRQVLFRKEDRYRKWYVYCFRTICM